MVQPRNTGNRPKMTKSIDCDVKHSHKRIDINQSIRKSEATNADVHKPETLDTTRQTRQQNVNLILLVALNKAKKYRNNVFVLKC